MRSLHKMAFVWEHDKSTFVKSKKNLHVKKYQTYMYIQQRLRSFYVILEFIIYYQMQQELPS